MGNNFISSHGLSTTGISNQIYNIIYPSNTSNSKVNNLVKRKSNLSAKATTKNIKKSN